MITVDELMTANPHTLKADNTLHDAWRVMTEKQIRHIPVVDEKNHLLGLVTQRDVLASTDPSAVAEDGSDVDSDTPLENIMIKHVTTIDPREHLRQAALHMQTHKHGCLPVLKEGELVGIITDSDFITIAINLLEQVELLEEQADDDFESDDLEDSDY